MNSMIYVGSVGQSVWRSKDMGETWQRLSRGMFMECEVRALVAHPSDPKIIYAGTDSGVYRTKDGGENWTRLDSPMNQMQIWSLAINPHNPDIMYAGTCPAQLFGSKNGGESWTKLKVNMPHECEGVAIIPRVTCIVIDPKNSSTVYAGVEIAGVYKSEDHGKSWKLANEGLTNLDIHGMAIYPDDPRIIIATTNSDIFKSLDMGNSWKPLEIKGRLPWSYCRGMIIVPDKDRTMYVGIGNGPPGNVGGLAKSKDLGESWELPNLGHTPNSTIWCLTVSPTDKNLIWVSSISGQVFRSADGGASWNKLKHEFGEVRGLLAV